jgi:nitroreductase
MEVIEALKSRRTIRQYDTNYNIPDDIINQLINAALDSPTGRNAQEIDLVVLANRAKIDEAMKITFDSWPADQQARWNGRKAEYGIANVISCDAPAIFFFVENERSADVPWAPVDTGIMCQSLMAAARAFGLHSMCLGALRWGNKAGLEKYLGIAEGKMVMGLAIGKARDGPVKISDKKRLCKATYVE